MPSITPTLLPRALAQSAAALPIGAVLDELCEHLRRRHEAVLEAAPGAGKTTVVPLVLLQQPWLHGKILLLEPRRMAARSAAARLAALLGETPGQTVGYRIRQETRIGPDTRLEVVTGGVLTRLLMQDPALEGYGLVIFDEFHERSLDSDLGLALTLQGRALLRDQDPLKILVMSATLDGEAIAALLHAPRVRSEGRQYPVALHHQATVPKAQLVGACCQAVLQALAQHQGSILVFLPGQKEILALRDALQAQVAENVQLAPLYGNLSLTEQQTAIAPHQPPWQRKVVLATDIAETSLTIEGVEVVIDSGFRRAPQFDPRTGLTRLHTTRISQASATQRAGRAGRLAAGVCYRLWSQQEVLQNFAPAEIEQADLAPLALTMLAFGVADPNELSWLTPPPAGAFAQAQDLLVGLGAAQRTATSLQLTEHGQRMAEFPAHPRLAHMILTGARWGLGDTACALAAALSEPGRPGPGVDLAPWVQSLQHSVGDQPWLRRARAVAQQFRQTLRADKFAAGTQTLAAPIGALLALAYPDRIARQRAQKSALFQLSNGRAAALDEAERLAGREWLVVAETGGIAGRQEDRIYAAAELDPADFAQALQTCVQSEDIAEWSAEQQRFVAERRWRIGQIIWRREKLSQLDPALKQRLLLNWLRQKGLQTLNWQSNDQQLRARVNLLRALPNASANAAAQGIPDWPDFSDDGLLASLDIWLAPHVAQVSTVEDLRKIDLGAALSTLLPWPLPQMLDDWAPTHLTVPSGSRVAVDYSQNPPVLAVKLQEMFGCEETPRIARGAVSLVIHLLSPAKRPLQITQDLGGFWRSSYQDVKKEMKGRYPKHPWPDDPLQAVPTRFTKNRPRPDQ